jgi:hypothetical protein
MIHRQSHAAFSLEPLLACGAGLLMGLGWSIQLPVSVAPFGKFKNDSRRAPSFNAPTPFATEAPYCE